MKNKPEDFKVYHHAVPQKENVYSYTTVKVLPELHGKKWDDVSLAFVLSLEPTAIRVTTGMVTLDNCVGRMTVIVNDDEVIQRIDKEVRIPLPEGVENAYDLRCKL